MKNKNKLQTKKAFTLMELLIVIAIIGILSGVVLVSTGSGVEKAKRASALTTAASILPELVACQDDGASVLAYASGGKICNDSGHSVTWPNVSAKTGYAFNAAAATNAQILTYTYTLTKTGQTTITCSYVTNDCN